MSTPFFKIFNIFSTEGTIPGSTDEKNLFFLDFKPFLQAQPIQEQIVAVEPGQDTALGGHFQKLASGLSGGADGDDQEKDPDQDDTLGEAQHQSGGLVQAMEDRQVRYDAQGEQNTPDQNACQEQRDQERGPS